MNTSFLAASALLISATLVPVEAQALPALWDAKVVLNQLEIPFRFETTVGEDRTASGAFFNGDERVRSTSGKFADGRLTLEFAHYGTKLVAEWDGAKLVGAYSRSGKGSYRFEAIPFRPVAIEDQTVPDISGQWNIAVKSPKGESAWKFFVRQSGAEVSASILRVDGDTGTLSGRFRDGKFVLSHFSGARPALVEIEKNADGSLSIRQNGGSAYTAVKSADARAKGFPEPADPSRWTSVADPSQPLRFHARSLDGVEISESDPRFHGKVVLVNITGSWCPNCHDEAPFLAELYRKYRAQGLEIVALSFEEADQLKDPVRLRAFIRNYGIEYPVLVAGDPEERAVKLPQAVNLNTWPATFFIGRDGLVRGAHAGFASRATGAEHERLKAEFQERVEQLLSENIRTAR